jgi:hypothetical protein
MPAPREILDLVARFEQQLDAYKSGQYNETQLRREFLDPFFKALGWDVDNTSGYAEAYKDVVHEDAIRIGDRAKAPDYCFRIGGTRKFFVEAKKPSVDIKEEVPPAYQVRSYAWSAKLPLSILSDFEEFAFYDCRIKPGKDDPAATARIFYCSFRDYAKKWDEIASIFSREAVLKGSFDRFAESTKAKKGTAEFDQDFLATIEAWRRELAQNLALRNPKLSQRELNFAVQRIIDRVIFLRICEARGIEDYGRLGALVNADRIYPRLAQLFEAADVRYNSGLFHFKKEPGRHEAPDELTLELQVDDKLLREILRGLYYPESPYRFSVISADILGQVYEQFLGTIIRLTEGHRAVPELKPEVRKAGGVYYTPTYIVDYIVRQTVGKLLEEIDPVVGRASPRAEHLTAGRAGESSRTARHNVLKKVSKLRILDPACGSGSFLIGAYQFLLDWHLQFYTTSDPVKWAKGGKPALVQTTRGWKLTIAERKRILLNSTFGVDIDAQAVEVTKLSLLLKVLEGETQQSIEPLFRIFHERALPDLGDNIKCGNSLIGPDFYRQAELPLLTDDEKYRINVFDWQAEFPEIFKAGGFDAVIGNPPYIPIEMMSEPERNYYQANHSQLERKYDSAPVFILTFLGKLKPSARLGFISSVTWQTGENFGQLRQHLFSKAGIETLINLPFDVFENAFVDTGVYIITRKPRASYDIFRFPKKEKIVKLDKIPFVRVPCGLISGPDFKVILDPIAHRVLQRALSNPAFDQLGNFTISTQGLAGDKFRTDSEAKNNDWFPFLAKGQARRYFLDVGERVYADMRDKPSLRRYYEPVPKLLVRRVISRQDRLLTAFTDQKLVFKKDINPFIVSDKAWTVSFVLGVLNSKLISYLYVNTSSIATKDDFRQTTLAELRKLPIPKLSGNDVRQERMVSLAEAMLDLHRKLAAAKTPQEKTALERQIAATDAEIDRLVYELYGLTEDEIKIVEGESKNPVGDDVRSL